jgi:hypothetical protein
VDALGRSWDLVRGNWWRVFGILAIAYLLIYVVENGVGGVLGAIALLIPDVSSGVRGAAVLLASAAVGVFVHPISSIVYVLLYFDLRVRKEAIDLDQMAGTAAGPPPPAPAY